MCSYTDAKTQRSFTKPCADLTTVASTTGGADTYTSDDLAGTTYYQSCPYFSNCGETRDVCHDDDFR